MKQPISAPDNLLAILVLAHLAVCLAHGVAHSRAGVVLSTMQTAFVYTVILAGPILGLGMQRFGLPRAGAWIVATTLAGALAFGLANHFLIAGTDHVNHVSAPWAPLFATTAALLFVTELSGVVAAVWCAIGRHGVSAVEVY